jgi:hypothetical protein
MGAHLDPTHKIILSKSMARWERELAAIHYREGRYAEAFRHARLSMKRSPGFGGGYRKALVLSAKSAARMMTRRSMFRFGESSK